MRKLSSDRIDLPIQVSSESPQAWMATSRYPAIPPSPEFEPEPPAVPLSHYLWILRRHLWKMLAFVAACTLVTFIVSARLKPIYESTATMDVDVHAPSDVVGQGSNASSQTVDPDLFLATQMKLIQSDAVLRPVVEQFHLLKQNPKQAGPDSRQAQAASAAPLHLTDLSVTRPPNTYLLLITYRSESPELSADVANAIANSYLARTYSIHIQSSASLSTFMEKQLDELKAKMEKSGLALAQFEKELDVVNPEAKTNILSARLLQLNTEYTSAQADRVSKEAAWNAIKSGSVEAAEISSQGQSLAKLNDALNQAKQRVAEVKDIYGTRHPEYRKAATQLAEIQRQFDQTRQSVAQKIDLEYRESLNREQMLQKAVNETKTEWDNLNTRSFEYQQLKQEADADKALYDELIKKIREADINAGFQNNNVSIADVARPPSQPVSPNTRRNLLLAFILSTLLAIAAALTIDRLDTTLRDPQETRRFLGTDVIGTLPLDQEASLLPAAAEMASKSKVMTGGRILGADDSVLRPGHYASISGFEEAIRTIRNSILLADFEQRLRSIVITSAEPGEGKTTMATHLAIANAARGKSTLLVDGDLRRPSIHSKFGIKPREGLSNVLTGELQWQDVVLPAEGRPNLSILTSGPGSHRAADLIGPRLAELLDEFAKVYDLVILDSPPLLGFAECLQMASAADGVVIVSRAGKTKRKSVAAVVSTLQRLRANIIGVVLNQVTQNTSEGGYSYYGYNHYSYRDPDAQRAE